MSGPDLTNQPWMTPEEIACVERHLDNRGYRMFEYGAGGSTVHFSKFVRVYISVEHSEVWWKEVRARLEGRERVTIHCVPPNSTQTDYMEQYERFRTYIETPWRLGEKFDRVLVDGRARVECCRAVLPWLHEGALLFFHDFLNPDKEYFRHILDWYEIVETAGTLAVLRVRQQVEPDGMVYAPKLRMGP